MAKRKRKPPSLPPHGDIGPDTKAQWDGAKLLPRREPNGQAFRRKDRRHIVEIMAEGNRRRPAILSRRQSAAGMALVDLYDATRRSSSPPWTRVVVDSSPRPDDATVNQLQAQWELAHAVKAIPRHCLWIVQAVCRDNQSLRPGITSNVDRAKSYQPILREGLDALAEYFRL